MPWSLSAKPVSHETPKTNLSAMNKFAVWAEFEAKPGKEAAVEAFLKSAEPMVLNEQGTKFWFAVRLSGARFAVFDTFSDETGRQEHLQGQVAKALMERAGELFATAPKIHMIDVLAEKVCAS